MGSVASQDPESATAVGVFAKETPTEDLLVHYQLAFDYLNEVLFRGMLPPCVLTFATHGRSQGYFTPARWERVGAKRRQQTAHEISLNPSLLDESTETILAVLAKLMAQLWQEELGLYPPNKQGYYNREYTEKLEEIGVPASVDGTADGAKTGYRMRHWIDPHGKFRKAIEEMPEKYFFPWKGSRKPKPPKRQMVKYGCPRCGIKGIFPCDVQVVCNTQACETVMERLG